MALCVLVARQLFVGEEVGAGWSLLGLVVLGVVVYLPLCAWRAPEVVGEVRDVVRSRTRASAPLAEAQPSSF
jgi:hypothetical protein